MRFTKLDKILLTLITIVIVFQILFTSYVISEFGTTYVSIIDFALIVFINLFTKNEAFLFLFSVLIVHLLFNYIKERRMNM